MKPSSTASGKALTNKRPSRRLSAISATVAPALGHRINVVIEKDMHGYFAYAPELEGCHTQGQSLDQAMANIRQAVELYLQTLTPGERRALGRKEIFTTALEV